MTGHKDPTSSVWSFTGGPWLSELLGNVALLHKLVLSWLPGHGKASCHDALPGRTDPKATEPGDHDGNLKREREQTLSP